MKASEIIAKLENIRVNSIALNKEKESIEAELNTACNEISVCIIDELDAFMENSKVNAFITGDVVHVHIENYAFILHYSAGDMSIAPNKGEFKVMLSRLNDIKDSIEAVLSKKM
jgi:hypothetical protein